MKIEYHLEYGSWATFKPNRQYPIYRWFYYKEGFSRDLVITLLSSARPKHVLDPFCGVGTTLLGAKELGIDSVGLDVLPLAVFVSRVKTRDYDPEEVERWANWMLSLRPEPYSTKRVKDPLVHKVFPERVLGTILWYLDALERVEDKEIRDLLKLALMNAAMKSSWAFKDGAIVKVVKRPVPPLRESLRRELKKIVLDVKAFPRTGARAEVLEADARYMPLEDESVDYILTSPPYLNKIEYTSVYRVEHALFFPKRGLPPLKSYIGMELEEEGGEEPPIVRAYFKDMGRVLSEMYRVLREGGQAVIVVGNAYLPEFDLIVDVDTRLAEMAEDIGFKAKKIVVLNERWATKKRTIKRGKVRESALFLQKV